MSFCIFFRSSPAIFNSSLCCAIVLDILNPVKIGNSILKENELLCELLSSNVFSRFNERPKSNFCVASAFRFGNRLKRWVSVSIACLSTCTRCRFMSVLDRKACSMHSCNVYFFCALQGHETKSPKVIYTSMIRIVSSIISG